MSLLKNHSYIGHVVVGCSVDSIPSCVFFIFHLTYNTSDFSSTINWSQINPLCYSSRGWTLVDWLARTQTQVMSPSSASTLTERAHVDQSSVPKRELLARVRRDDRSFRGSSFASTLCSIKQQPAFSSMQCSHLVKTKDQ